MVFEELASWWDQQPIAASLPFLNSQIVSCWEEGMDEPGSRLHVKLLRRAGELVAALPLYRSAGRLRSPCRAFTYSTDIVAVDDEEVRSYLPRWLDDVAIAHLYRLREDSPLVAAVPEHPRWSIPSTLRCPYVDLSGGIDSVWSGLKAGLRKGLRRRRRRLDEMGTVTYMDHAPPAEVDRVLQKGWLLEAAGWKGRKGVATLSVPATERWYRSVAERAEDQGWLRVSSLHLDDRMLAFSLDLVYGGRRFGLNSSYDESIDVSRTSPGNLLFEFIIEQTASEGLQSYELSFAGGDWKYDWTSRSRLVYDLLIFGSGPLGRGLSLIRRAKDRRAS
jgi:CelD/BcsL family acetyltransferase involved in cellulose biosynthesis